MRLFTEQAIRSGIEDCGRGLALDACRNARKNVQAGIIKLPLLRIFQHRVGAVYPRRDLRVTAQVGMIAGFSHQSPVTGAYDSSRRITSNANDRVVVLLLWVH